MEPINRKHDQDTEAGPDDVRVPLTARPRIASRLSGDRGMFGGWGPKIG
jgi:hypothetical protein